MNNTLDKLKFQQVGTTMFVFQAETKAQVDKLMRTAMLRGDAKLNADGSREWISDVEIIDTTKSGSEMYQWDTTGNKVKHERRHYTLTKDGELSYVVERTVWKGLD